MEIPIRIAFGVEFRNLNGFTALREYLEQKVKSDNKMAQIKDNVYKYKRDKIIYDIKIIFSKKEFLNALDMPNAIVIYEGHSRLGQGPVFTEDANFQEKCAKDGINPWEDHVRMGWDIRKIPMINEILFCINRSKSHSKTG